MHAGNPARTDKEYPVAYLWEPICQRDAWLRIFHSFVYVEKKDVVDLKGNWSKKETLIFPRFHQWAAVNAMIGDARSQRARNAVSLRAQRWLRQDQHHLVDWPTT